MTNVNDHAIILLHYMLDKGLVAPNGLSPRELRVAVGLSDNDFGNAENFLLQDHLLEGGGGLDGIRWLTPRGVKFITEEMKHRTPVSFIAERILGLLIRDVKDDESLPMKAIIAELKITPQVYMETCQELDDLGFVKKTFTIIDDYPELIPTKEGRLAFRKGFQETVSVPSIQAGAIFTRPVTGGNIQAIASASDSEIQQYENTVFVSYSWGGESEHTVDELERAFAEHGIRIVRDKKYLDYKGSIKAFEQRISQGQCIVLVINDKYLRSEHCMYELVEMDKNQRMRERIFPIVLADARIYKAVDRLAYIKYWDEQIEQLNQAIKQVGVITDLAGITANLDKYARIRANFDHLTDLLSDMNALTPEMHAANGFSTLISAVERAMAGE